MRLRISAIICADGGDVTPTGVPSFEYDASCACSVNQCDIVGDYDAYALVLAHDFDYGFPCFTINVVGGFVKHEHIGTRCDCASDLQSFRFASGKRFITVGPVIADV